MCIHEPYTISLWMALLSVESSHFKPPASLVCGGCCPVWAREHCRISQPRFLAECCKRQRNQGSFVLLYFRLFAFSDLYWVCLSVFSCIVLFVSISQVIGCEDCLRNDLYCVQWGVKLYSNQPSVVAADNVEHCLSLVSYCNTPLCCGSIRTG